MTDRIEERAREIERRANDALAELHFAATDGEVENAIKDIIPDGWEWIDASYLGGPRMIALTKYPRADCPPPDRRKPMALLPRKNPRLSDSAPQHDQPCKHIPYSDPKSLFEMLKNEANDG